jgi:hypothetical protein
VKLSVESESVECRVLEHGGGTVDGNLLVDTSKSEK